MKYDDERLECYRCNGHAANVNWDDFSNGDKIYFFEAKSKETFGHKNSSGKIPMVEIKGLLTENGEIILLEVKSAFPKDWELIQHLFKKDTK